MSDDASRTPVRSMRRHLLLAALLVVPVSVAGAAVLAGGVAARSALLGAALVTVVMLLGFEGITAIVSGPAGLSMAGAAIVYLGQLIVLVAAIAYLRGLSWLDGAALAVAGIVTLVGLQVGQITGYVRARHELVDTPLGPRP